MSVYLNIIKAFATERLKGSSLPPEDAMHTDIETE